MYQEDNYLPESNINFKKQLINKFYNYDQIKFFQIGFTTFSI